MASEKRENDANTQLSVPKLDGKLFFHRLANVYKAWRVSWLYIFSIASHIIDKLIVFVWYGRKIKRKVCGEEQTLFAF
jgi:hypothetical protein